MPFAAIAAIRVTAMARGAHALPAAFALAASGMELDRDAITDLELIDIRPQRHDDSHAFMAWPRVLDGGRPALEHRERTEVDGLKFRCAICDSIEQCLRLGTTGFGRVLVNQLQCAGTPAHPCLPLLRHGQRVGALHAPCTTSLHASVPIPPSRVAASFGWPASASANHFAHVDICLA